MEHEIHKAGGILLRGKKLLVERSRGKTHFIAPGGSVEPGETPAQALVRELKEEFRLETREADFTPFGSFSAEAAGRPGVQVRMDVFVVKEWEGEPAPDNEVEEIAWIDSNIPAGMRVGSIFEHEVIPRLKNQGLIT